METKTLRRDDHVPPLKTASEAVPLVIDLDGTLLGGDLLHETFLDAVSTHGWRVIGLLRSGAGSKQALKASLSKGSHINFAALPFDDRIVQLATTAKASGRMVYLATASHRTLAEGVAEALGIFDGVFASDDTVNLKGAAKAEVLEAAFGARRFDYAGNDASDLAVWAKARKAIAVNLPPRVDRKLQETHPDRQVIAPRAIASHDIIKALRPHQYAKNFLVFVPFLTAHVYTLATLTQAFLAFAAFCMCASGAYVLNDLLDLQADRDHPTKRNRPFASGRLPVSLGLLLVPMLTLAAFAIAWLVSPTFTLVLATYYALTNLYSLNLKRRMILDVVALSLLYTLRVLGGAVAINVAVSEWLFTFSLLMFTALALVKRYIELAGRLDRGMDDPSNRNYRVGDLPVIAGLAAAAGMNSIMVLALYVSSDDVAAMYARPELLWGLCPLFLYWIARLLMLAHRRMVDDDPIAFALKDDRSWVVGFLAVVLVMAALWT